MPSKSSPPREGGRGGENTSEAGQSAAILILCSPQMFDLINTKLNRHTHTLLLPSLPEGSAFSVCLSVGVRNSKTVALIHLLFFTQEGVYPWLAPPLR